MDEQIRKSNQLTNNIKEQIAMYTNVNGNNFESSIKINENLKSLNN